MAMNCQEFLDEVTQVGASSADGLLKADAAAHLNECADCQAWYAAAQPALAHFAMAGCCHAAEHDPQVFADSIAVYVESDVPASRSPTRMSRLLRERFTISWRTQREEDAASGHTSSAVETTPVSEDASAQIAPAEKFTKTHAQRVSDAFLRIAAGVVILLLALSFLQLPNDAEVAGTHTPAQLLPTNATLDSLGLVAACVEPRQLDVHSALLADHFGDLSCCTRCHQSAGARSPHLAIGDKAGEDKLTVTGSRQVIPKLSDPQRSLLAESCLLCHQG